jgi:galactonate dehydratase
MKITAIETIRLEEFPNLPWVQVHTDEGLIGLGELFCGVTSAEAHIQASWPSICWARTPCASTIIPRR